ncbi:uncharacterized protein RCO7_04059 [Rhynchosporium graminicola]|uniref:Uncharacterized protein n=1 Tax=Rhynchosporium graminicola TaxID=2792576 RepID=A0A1E1LF80_9HELO|nr:uncharacterized protein RCO7_04059 [Rhynchosporium commune]
MVGKTDEVQSLLNVSGVFQFNQLEFFTKPMKFSQNSKHYWSIVRLRSVVREVASGISKVIGRTKLAYKYLEWTYQPLPYRNQHGQHFDIGLPPQLSNLVPSHHLSTLLAEVAYGKATEHDQQQEEEVVSGVFQFNLAEPTRYGHGMENTRADRNEQEQQFVADTTEEEPNLTEESQDGGQSSLHRSIKVVGIATSRLEMDSA